MELGLYQNFQLYHKVRLIMIQEFDFGRKFNYNLSAQSAKRGEPT